MLRKIKAGAVHINGERVNDLVYAGPHEDLLIQAGKNWRRVRMLALSAIIFGSRLDSIRAHKLRAALTVLGLTMGVATLITVMTLVQGANIYVEQKIANLGTNVFRVAKTPFAVVDFTVITKALKNKLHHHRRSGRRGGRMPRLPYVGRVGQHHACGPLSEQAGGRLDHYGYTPNMVDIDTRTLGPGRYFTETEDRHAAYVCLIGASVADTFFPGVNPLGHIIRAANQEFTVIGTFEKLGSVLGQDQDNFFIIPLNTYLKGARHAATA